MEKRWILVAACLSAIAVSMASLYMMIRDNEGWLKVPRKVYEFDQLPGEEVTVRGFLEKNDRTVLAIPNSGEPSLITDEDVDRIVAEGLGGQYDYRKPAWTHRIRLDSEEIEPNFVIDGRRYYVILSTGTGAWKSSDLFDDFVGKEVEMIIKWDSYMVAAYPHIRVTQIQARAIREART